MKYYININQFYLSKNTNLDLVDAVILDYLYYICNTKNEKISKNRIEDYTWIQYNHLLKELPLLNIKSKSSLSSRLKKIENNGFIKIMQVKEKIYVSLTEKVDNLFFVQTVLPEEQQLFFQKNSTVLPEEQNKYININNINNNILDEKKDQKNEIYNLNLEYKEKVLNSIKDKIKKEENIYDWKYILDTDKKISLESFLVAIYWKTKQSLSNGYFSYRFKDKSKFQEQFKFDLKYAKSVVRCIKLENEFKKLIEIVDEEAYDKKNKTYKYEYKLSTILKKLNALNN